MIACLLMFGLIVVAPTATATAAGCSLPNPGPMVPTPWKVIPPFLNALGPAACTVTPVLGPPGPAPTATGLVFTSGAPPCPPIPFVGPLPGELCGPLVPAFTTMHCTATWAGPIDQPRLYGLVIGLDYVVGLTADGNVNQIGGTDIEPLRHNGGFQPAMTYSVQITNPLPVDARVIAYPIVNQPQAPVMVGCV